MSNKSNEGKRSSASTSARARAPALRRAKKRRACGPTRSGTRSIPAAPGPGLLATDLGQKAAEVRRIGSPAPPRLLSSVCAKTRPGTAAPAPSGPRLRLVAPRTTHGPLRLSLQSLVAGTDLGQKAAEVRPVSQLVRTHPHQSAVRGLRARSYRPARGGPVI